MNIFFLVIPLILFILFAIFLMSKSSELSLSTFKGYGLADWLYFSYLVLLLCIMAILPYGHKLANMDRVKLSSLEVYEDVALMGLWIFSFVGLVFSQFLSTRKSRTQLAILNECSLAAIMLVMLINSDFGEVDGLTKWIGYNTWLLGNLILAVLLGLNLGLTFFRKHGDGEQKALMKLNLLLFIGVFLGLVFQIILDEYYYFGIIMPLIYTIGYISFYRVQIRNREA